jgi:hypothetical protein
MAATKYYISFADGVMTFAPKEKNGAADDTGLNGRFAPTILPAFQGRRP